jgi:maltose alpha-D-glucosyltransferase/alpha-amylase
MTDRPSIAIGYSLDQVQLLKLLPQLLGRAMPSFLTAQRWFGDKARTIAATDVVATSIVPVSGDYVFLSIIEVAFAHGEPAPYFVPMVVSDHSDPQTPAIATIDAAGVPWSLTDAVHSQLFRQWLLSELGRDGTDRSGAFRWSSTSALRPALANALHAESRVSAAQQSNSSLIYGTSIILKVFRRLSPGVNPEIELGRFLTTRTSFRNIPLLLGDWTYRPAAGDAYSLAVAQTYIASVGDGWTFTLDLLRNSATRELTAAQRLGQLTADMHLAFESARGDPDLVPERIQPDDATAWSEGVRRSIDATIDSLKRRLGVQAGEMHDLISTAIALGPRLTSQVSGFERLIGHTKSRVHGDFHLGQTLRTTEGDFVILDFEGEPQRPIAERRAKTSPLKDVAGMLRSFSYARGAIEREHLTGDGKQIAPRAELIGWERSVRRAYLDSYVAESRRGGAHYLPASDDDVRQALAAWELDKALYEVRYELNNRPDWLEIPLSAVVKLAS